MTDPATPAIAGAGQAVQRPGSWTDPVDALGPIELMVQAARRAADDAGTPKLLERLDWVGVARGFWSYTNPGQVLARELGSPDAVTGLSALSGTSPQELVAVAASRIARGECNVALVAGGEARWSARRLKQADQHPTWIDEPGDTEPEQVGSLPDAVIDEARELGGAVPAYALIEDSLRMASGESIDEHRDRIAELWASFSAVAAANPFAWDQAGTSAAAIREPTPDNRMIAFPYTKAQVANNTVDMASAVLLCSVQAARDAGISTDRLVFPQAATAAHDTWRLASRRDLHRTPALAAASQHALEVAGVDAADLNYVDLYACFPAIVQMSAEALGLDLSRPLTLTGGLGFAGAAIANSTGHALAAMVPLLRGGGVALIHANGGNATKHAFGIYSHRPATAGFRIADSQARADLDERPRAGADAAGTVEAATVTFDRHGPVQVIATALTDHGERFFTRSRHPDVVAQAMAEGLVGEPAPLPSGPPATP